MNGCRGHLLSRNAVWLAALGLFVAFVTIKYFVMIADPAWAFTGDTANNFNMTYYHYAGFMRGEYAYWNPLVRTGEPTPAFQVTQLAGPLNNVPLFALSLFGVNDMVLTLATVIAAYAAAYVSGIYFLVRLLTADRKAAAFSAILAAISSPVIFSSFHVSFIMITHGLPWMIYGLLSYFRTYRLVDAVIACTAAASFLYSYEFVMGLLFLCLCGVGYLAFGGARTVPGLIAGVPPRHLPAIAIMAAVALAPMALYYVDFLETIRYTKAAGLSMTDDFSLEWRHTPVKRLIDYVLHPKLWATLFSGAVFTSDQELRQVVGPLAPALIAAAVLVPGKGPAARVFALAGILATAVHFQPLNLVFKVFPFSFIHNTHFLYQFLVLAAVIVAGLGFAGLADDKTRRRFMYLNAFVLVCLAGALVVQFAGGQFAGNPFATAFRAHNVAVLALGCAAAGAFVVAARYASGDGLKNAVVVISALFAAGASVLYDRLPMAGDTIAGAAYGEIRYPRDFGLKFLPRRPDQQQGLALPKELHELDLYKSNGGAYSSNITLTDNSYILNVTASLGTFPQRKEWVAFLTLPGHAAFLARKFHLFESYFTSGTKRDMKRLLDRPELFPAMLAGGVAMVDGPQAAGTDLGKFKPEKVMALAPRAAAAAPRVDNVAYRADGIRFTVSLERPGVLAYTDLWTPGWSATIDGRAARVVKVFHTYKGVALAAGTHTVAFSHFSWAVAATILMNVLFLVGLAGTALWAVRRCPVRHERAMRA